MIRRILIVDDDEEFGKYVATVAEDFADVFRETSDVVGKVTSDVVWISLEPLEIEFTVIVEAQILSITRDVIQDAIEVTYLPVFQCIPMFYDRLFGRFQHTIETTQHGHG